jgi:phospholipid/cholesterol/gamma-HCH transport system permease protein
MLPLLTLVADVGGLIGGLLVSWTLLGIEPALFLQRLVESLGQQPFWVGMAKVPLFALAISTTGCRHGLSVGGDVQSLGDRVTRAVVQSIFLIIMFDALFAVLFQKLHL